MIHCMILFLSAWFQSRDIHITKQCFCEKKTKFLKPMSYKAIFPLYIIFILYILYMFFFLLYSLLSCVVFIDASMYSILVFIFSFIFYVDFDVSPVTFISQSNVFVERKWHSTSQYHMKLTFSVFIFLYMCFFSFYVSYSIV